MMVPFGLIRTKNVPMMDATIDTAPSATGAQRERHHDRSRAEREHADKHGRDGVTT